MNMRIALHQKSDDSTKWSSKALPEGLCVSFVVSQSFGSFVSAWPLRRYALAPIAKPRSNLPTSPPPQKRASLTDGQQRTLSFSNERGSLAGLWTQIFDSGLAITQMFRYTTGAKGACPGFTAKSVAPLRCMIRILVAFGYTRLQRGLRSLNDTTTDCASLPRT
jgi:hypothetical protein